MKVGSPEAFLDLDFSDQERQLFDLHRRPVPKVDDEWNSHDLVKLGLVVLACFCAGAVAAHVLVKHLYRSR